MELPLPKKFGRPMTLESPEVLWDLAQDYFKEVDANPWMLQKLIPSGELAGVIMQIPTQRPYTWSGLGVYCFKRGYNSRLDEYKSARRGGKYEDFAEVIQLINDAMYRQKFDGATVGSFNANIISADLGLANKTIVETRDKTDEFDYSDLSDEVLEEIEAARRKKKLDE